MSKIVISSAIIVGCLCAILAVNSAGVSSRQIGASAALASGHPAVYLVKTTSEVYRLWERKKAQGRVVVHLGRFLHYVQPGFNPDYSAPLSGYPVKVRPSRDVSGDEVTYRNFLWFAMDKGIMRESYNVIPLRDFQQRFGLGTANSHPRDVVEHDNASARIMTVLIPSVREPVLLNIDASYLGNMDLAELARQLRASALSADIVTVCLSEDSPDVSPAERSKALEFVGRLSAVAGAAVPGSYQ